MTVTRQYRCDLCKDFIRPTNDTPREGFGVHFFGVVPTDGAAWLALKRTHECKHHICVACAKAVHDELRKIMPADEKDNAELRGDEPIGEASRSNDVLGAERPGKD